MRSVASSGMMVCPKAYLPSDYIKTDKAIYIAPQQTETTSYPPHPTQAEKSQARAIPLRFIVIPVLFVIAFGVFHFSRTIYLKHYCVPPVILKAHKRIDKHMGSLYNDEFLRVNATIDHDLEEGFDDSLPAGAEWYVDYRGRRMIKPSWDSIPDPPKIFEFKDNSGTPHRLTHIRWTKEPKHQPRIISCTIEEPFSFKYRRE
jgi:hypothetical protein